MWRCHDPLPIHLPTGEHGLDWHERTHRPLSYATTAVGGNPGLPALMESVMEQDLKDTIGIADRITALEQKVDALSEAGRHIAQGGLEVCADVRSLREALRYY